MHEILEDHLVEPSELLASDRTMEVPAASTEKSPNLNITAVDDHVPCVSEFFLPPSLQRLDSSFWISSMKVQTQMRYVGARDTKRGGARATLRQRNSRQG